MSEHMQTDGWRAMLLRFIVREDKSPTTEALEVIGVLSEAIYDSRQRHRPDGARMVRRGSVAVSVGGGAHAHINNEVHVHLQRRRRWWPWDKRQDIELLALASAIDRLADALNGAPTSSEEEDHE
jgi:hypothetical protein